MTYDLEGRLIEICSCGAICPCLVNQLPDKGGCDVTVAWHVDKGQVEGGTVRCGSRAVPSGSSTRIQGW